MILPHPISTSPDPTPHHTSYDPTSSSNIYFIWPNTSPYFIWSYFLIQYLLHLTQHLTVLHTALLPHQTSTLPDPTPHHTSSSNIYFVTQHLTILHTSSNINFTWTNTSPYFLQPNFLIQHLLHLATILPAPHLQYHKLDSSLLLFSLDKSQLALIF